MKNQAFTPPSLHKLPGVILLLGLYLTNLSAQRMPVRETLTQDQMVSFPASAKFEQVIKILSSMASKFENKVIIDPTGQKGPINIEIPPCHWLKALEILVNAFNLEYADRGSYLEIVAPTTIESPVTPVIVPAAAPPEEEAKITKNSREIEISAIFFQGDRRTLAEAGIDWSVFASKSNIDIKSLAATAVSQEFFSLSSKYSIRGLLSIDGLFRTFEAMNIGEVIARPSIMVLDQTRGKIQVGSSFSIKQKDFAGNTTDRFFDVGTILEVTPKVITDHGLNFIYLTIHAERSSATPGAVSTTIDKQVAETEILLVNGEQTVIAGLYSEENANVRKGIPGLKDLPWWVFGLRYITGYNSSDRIKKELVIVLKAELVPTLEERMRTKTLSLDEALEQQRSQYPAKPR